MTRSAARTLPTLAVLLASSLTVAQTAPVSDSSPTSILGRIAEFTAAEYFWQQTDIARALIATGDRSVIAAIRPYLETNDRRRRCNAAFVLAGLGDKRGTAILISELEDTEVGSRIVEDVPSTGPGSLASGGISQVRSDRYFAALLLGELREKDAVPALITAMRDQSIHYRAAISLGEIGDTRAVPALREMVAAFPAERVFAGYGLAALGVLDGFDTLEEVALSDEQWVQRRYAVELLGKTMDRRAVPILLRALRDEQHPNVRVSTVRSLAEIGDPAALPALRVALGDGEATVVNAPTTVAAEAAKGIEAIESRGR